MGNAPIQLGLKTDKQSYQHGETMTGTVYISVSSVNPTIQNYQGIRLQFAGHENTEVRVEEKSGDTTTYRTVRESSNILRVEVPMTNFKSPLRVAKYEFPFSWTLPNAPLPSSFKHRVPCDRKGHCEVKYTLSAYLYPQETPSFFSGPTTRNSATFASQTIHFVGAPTRSIPEPIHIGEERTTMNGFCCCWRQGHVLLGFEADTVVLTPDAPCHLTIWGSNASAIPVQCLRVQLIQSVQWQAGNEHHKRHTRSNNSTLIDYNVDVSHLPQWDPIHPASIHHGYQAATDDDIQHEPVTTSFQVPTDIMDSYQGQNCTVEHALIVSAVTRMMATTPQVSYKIHLQRAPSTATVPVATAWMEEAEYTDVVLPSDWAPDEKVPVIHLREITTMESGGGVAAAAGNVATAQAIVMDPPVNPAVAASARPVAATAATVASEPPPVHSKMYPGSAAAPPVVAAATAEPAGDDPMAFARAAGMTDDIDMAPAATAPLEEEQFTDLQQVQALLKQIDPNDMTTYRRVEQQIQQLPACQRVLATMTAEDYQFLCQVGTPVTIARISYLLASELNKGAHGFRGSFLVALMQLPVAQETSISLIGSLTEMISDLEQSADFVQQQLRPEDAKWFKQRVDEWAY